MAWKKPDGGRSILSNPPSHPGLDMKGNHKYQISEKAPVKQSLTKKATGTLVEFSGKPHHSPN